MVQLRRNSDVACFGKAARHLLCKLLYTVSVLDYDDGRKWAGAVGPGDVEPHNAVVHQLEASQLEE
jgi:hypothetical protein